ncbi:MAG: box helicase [Herbinix sp.]|jgi:ATP-dependent RNA helicase RhlE|nr:box helicase [Herbinix sp.]
MQFKELNVIPPILKALEKENYEVPTPIQEKAIPYILSGRDLLGCAQTGTGKTAAFAIPTLQLLCEDKHAHDRNIKALIVTPTRELALQIYESFCTYGKYTKLKYCVVFGGVSQKPQEEKLRQGVDVLVATPGRLNDLIGQGHVDLKYVKILILDEADRMLDMGFINDVKKIIARTPVTRQTLLFSATMPTDIAALSNTILKNPAKVEITPVSSTVDTIKQYLYYVDKVNKKDLLLHILKDNTMESVLVFTRTKHGADRIVKQLSKEKVIAQAIHGDKSQGARQNALSNFKNKKLRILIATDIAARGIDIDELSHVVNYDLPNVPETYVHRIGRTGRAGLGGVAISFCDYDEKPLLADIEQLIGKRLQEVKDHPYPLLNEFPAIKVTQPRREPSRTSTSSSSSQKALMKTNIATGKEPTKAKPEQEFEKTALAKRSFTRPTGTNQARTKQAASKQTASPKKKFRMTADGVLKEKRSFNKFPKKSTRDSK